MRILIILALLAIPVGAQTPKPRLQPDYEAIIKQMEAQVEKLEQNLEKSQKADADLREIERIAREDRVTASRSYHNPQPYHPASRYYPTSRYYQLYYPRYYPRSYPRLLRGSTIYRNYHRW